MNFRKFLCFLCTAAFLACTTINVNHAPKKSDFVDPQLRKYVNEYMDLAKIMNIRFDRTIGADFIKVEEPNVIGLCYYMVGYRQIQIDLAFWRYADTWQRTALVYHELTHCYCTRKHDFEGKKFADTDAERKEEYEHWKKTGERPGYFEDGCPKSLMHPTIVESFCMQLHYGEYILEMFDRCSAY
jgi:hypothetical protein